MWQDACGGIACVYMDVALLVVARKLLCASMETENNSKSARAEADRHHATTDFAAQPFLVGLIHSRRLRHKRQSGSRESLRYSLLEATLSCKEAGGQRWKPSPT